MSQLAQLGMNIGGAARSLEHNGEADVLRWVSRAVVQSEEVPVICDVGANTGQYAECALKHVRPPVRLFCFEPALAAYQALEAASGRKPGVSVHRVALGSEETAGELFVNSRHSGVSSLSAEAFALTGIAVEEQQAIVVRRLDKFCQEMGLRQVHLLKVDVEGAEYDVLKGAGSLIAQQRIKVIQFEFGERSLAFRSYLRDFFTLLNPGYRLFRIIPGGVAALVRYESKLESFSSAANYLAVARCCVQPDEKS